MPAGEQHHLEQELEELAALADGTLPPARRAALEERVAASPQLQALLEEQRSATAAVQARDERAPAGLHRRVAALREHRPLPPYRGRIALVLVAACALAAVVLLRAGSEPGTPTVAQAAALTAKGPAPDGSGPRWSGTGLLRLEGARLPYPDWSHEYGWHAAGARRDRLGNRDTTTVFYLKHGRRIGYTIVSGSGLAVPAGTVRKVKEGTVLHTARIGGRPVTVWQRRGSTCVLSGDGVTSAGLQELASWRARGALPF
jgi:hypothetical protein